MNSLTACVSSQSIHVDERPSCVRTTRKSKNTKKMGCESECQNWKLGWGRCSMKMLNLHQGPKCSAWKSVTFEIHVFRQFLIIIDAFHFDPFCFQSMFPLQFIQPIRKTRSLRCPSTVTSIQNLDECGKSVFYSNKTTSNIQLACFISAFNS